MNKNKFIHIYRDYSKYAIYGGLQMKKVTAFIGNQQKHATFEAVCEFGNNLKAYGDIEFEYVF